MRAVSIAGRTTVFPSAVVLPDGSTAQAVEIAFQGTLTNAGNVAFAPQVAMSLLNADNGLPVTDGPKPIDRLELPQMGPGESANVSLTVVVDASMPPRRYSAGVFVYAPDRSLLAELRSDPLVEVTEQVDIVYTNPSFSVSIS